MSVPKKTAADYAAELEAAILVRNADYDTKVGPIPDLYIQPTANVLELQNDRVRQVQQLLSLVNDDSFTDEDLDEFVYNESIVRLQGSRATATLVFSRSTVPTSNVIVKANFPVATLADESSGSAITFLTTEEVTMLAASAASYFNSTTQRYELLVPARAITGSAEGNVGPNRIVRPLRPLNGFDSVFNRSAAIGGADKETNDSLIRRYFLALLGSSPTVVYGIQKLLRDKHPEVLDSNVVYGNNPLNVRAATDAGAVDVYIIGNAPTSTTETVIFPGANQPIKLTKQPVLSITSAGAYVSGTDYVLSKDTSNLANSVRSIDGISWTTTGSTPLIGAPVVVTYTYDALPLQLQNAFLATDRDTPGRDILFKTATQINVGITANVRIRSGFNVTATVNAVTDAIVNFINSLELSDDLELSDLQAVVRSFSGVDNFIITNIAKVGLTGTTDLAVNDNEYVRISSSDLVVTVI